METSSHLLMISYLWLWGWRMSLVYECGGSDSRLGKDVGNDAPWPWLDCYRAHNLIYLLREKQRRTLHS